MNLHRAIKDTILYSSYFGFPLFRDEIHHWLICSRPVSLSQIEPLLPPDLSPKEKKYRSMATRQTEEKIHHALKLVRILRFVPGIRLIALTGSVAAQNTQSDDDIDLFFVTSPNSLWLVRPVVLALISLLFRRRHPREDHSHAPNAFCPNLWLDSQSLSLPASKQSLYTAHEVLQVLPLLDRGETYQQFLKENQWSKKFLANAYHSIKSDPSPKKTETRHLISEIYPICFVPFNYLSYLLQLLYMSPKKTSETVHLHGAFLHTTDFNSEITSHLDRPEDI